MGGVNGPEEGVQSVHVGRPFATTEDELKWLLEHATDLYEMFRRKYDDEGDRSERYRTAWLSANRRAARESVYATEALALRDAEIADLRARLRESTHGVSDGPLHLGL